jgi:hypothetical protein
MMRHWRAGFPGSLSASPVPEGGGGRRRGLQVHGGGCARRACNLNDRGLSESAGTARETVAGRCQWSFESGKLETGRRGVPVSRRHGGRRGVPSPSPSVTASLSVTARPG